MLSSSVPTTSSGPSVSASKGSAPVFPVPPSSPVQPWIQLWFMMGNPLAIWAASVVPPPPAVLPQNTQFVSVGVASL